MRTVSDGVISSSTSISSATANFTQADVGKAILVYVGSVLKVSGGTCPTITAVTSSTTATISIATNASVSGVTFSIGTDNSAAFAAAFAALFAQPGGGVLYIPAGTYLNLSRWGVLGNSTTTPNYWIIGDDVPAVSTGSLATIVMSPYIAYTPFSAGGFWTKNFAGGMANLFFTDLSISNFNFNSISNISMFKFADLSSNMKDMKYSVSLPTGGGTNTVLSIALDGYTSWNDNIQGSTVGAVSLFGSTSRIYNMSAVGGAFGIQLVDTQNGLFVGGTFTGSAGPGVVMGNASLAPILVEFYGATIHGGGVTTSSAIVTNGAGLVPKATFTDCFINYDNVSAAGNSSAVYDNFAGNTLWFKGCTIMAYGTGVGVTTNGNVVLSSCLFLTGMPWTASIKVWSQAETPTVIEDSNGNIQVCSTSGTTGASAPTWATVKGNTTTDNTAAWRCEGPTPTLVGGTGTIINGGGNLGISSF
jgi:hypothetical protein